MHLHTVPLGGRPTDNMVESLAKGKACLSCRARKSVSCLYILPLVLTAPHPRLEMRRYQTILWQMHCERASLRISEGV